VTLAYSTQKVGHVINYHAAERVEAAKEHSRMLFHEKRAAAEGDKKMKVLQKAEKARAAQEQKSAMSSWLKGSKKGSASPAPADDEKSSNDASSVSSASDNDEHDSDETSGTDEEEAELMDLQAKGVISRQEYIVRRKKLSQEKEEKRKQLLEQRKKQKLKDQYARKRLLVTEELHVAMEVRDVDRLRSSLKSARDLGMSSKRPPRNGEPATPAEMKLVEDAEAFLEKLEADVVKEQEMEERKRIYEKTMREFFIRTEPIGKDRHRGKYWVFRGDPKRVYIEDEHHNWSYYESPEAIVDLVESLDPRGIRECSLKHELEPLIESFKNTSVKEEEEEGWKNKERSWSEQLLPNMSVADLRDQMLQLESWLSKHLYDKSKNTWTEATRDAWVASLQACEQPTDLIQPLLTVEREVTSIHMSNLIHGQDEDEEEDDDEEVFVETGLWPSKQARERWVAQIRACSTLAAVGLAFASFLQRMDVIGLSKTNVVRKIIRKEKEEKKELEETPKKELTPVKSQEWEEYCCVCGDGGELLCCDGCPRVFHYTCVGLRRIPRGKTFCPNCDKTVKPVFPVVRRESERQNNVKSEASNPPATQHQWDSYCNECGSSGSLILCDGCPKAFHASCLNMDEVFTSIYECTKLCAIRMI
ncbi:hypothetical protein THRCLA_10244, partial [Thraustotheca clavata]